MGLIGPTGIKGCEESGGSDTCPAGGATPAEAETAAATEVSPDRGGLKPTPLPAADATDVIAAATTEEADVSPDRGGLKPTPLAATDVSAELAAEDAVAGAASAGDALTVGSKIIVPPAPIVRLAPAEIAERSVKTSLPAVTVVPPL
jgi:hypothetical protein